MLDLAQHARSQQLALRATVLQRLLVLWPALDFRRLDATFPAWALSVGTMVLAQHAVSARLASDYLHASRYLSGVPGSPEVVRATPPASELLATSLGVTSVTAIKRALSAGRTEQQSMDSGFVQSSGAASRLVLDGGRDTIVETVKADPRARSWERVTSGTACAYCEERAGVTFAGDGEIFSSHDHCACSAAVKWD